jgi:2-oxo-4-hydroxy-4-carboxy-5-ureidoimidazoline decarboxylase
MIFGYAKEKKLLLIGIKIIHNMNIAEINLQPKEIFINKFKNIFEKTTFITKDAENQRPYQNKIHMINIFISIFDLLDIKKKIKIICSHPDLGDKVKINQGLTKLSKDEQSQAGLTDCTEEEFKLFNELNAAFKLKFNIPFIFAVRGKNKNDIIKEFNSRLVNSNVDSEINISIEQVKKIALLRLEEIIDD